MISKLKVIIGFSILIILFLLRPIKTLRFGYFQSSRIGGLIPQFQNYFSQKSNKNKYFDFICFERIICNLLISNLIRKKIKIYNYNKIIFFIIDCLKKVNHFSSDHLIKMESMPLNNFLNENDSFLSEIDKPKINTKTKYQGKFICIHNRDQGYLNKKFPNQDWSYHNFRDFKIKDMDKLINYFLKEDYGVVRLGTFATDEVGIKNTKIIDYPFLPNKSDFDEYSIINNCEFYVGSSAGIWMYPLYLKKKMLILNWYQYELLSKLRHNRFSIVPKLYFDIKLDKYLKLDEICKRNLDKISLNENFREKNITLINNTSDEILDSAIEFSQNYDSGVEDDIVKEFWSILEKYNPQYSQIINVKVCKIFLNKHKNLLF